MGNQLLEDFEVSNVNWTELENSASNSSPDEEEAAENVKFFETLQSDPTWGSFFHRFGKDELVVGRKFAEGAQGELYEAHIQRDDPVWRYEVKKHPDRKYVLKVFKFGTPLRNMKEQWPEGYLRFQEQRLAEQHSRRYNCDVICGTLLEDARFKGRFAFLLQREEEDLRSLIDRKMRREEDDLRSLIDRKMRRCTIRSPWTIFRRAQPLGPFSKEVAKSIMYEIACGVDWLHRHDIVHRDLKAANVLVSKGTDDKLNCFVADYECSVGCVGTGLFKAPEIFQALAQARAQAGQAHNGDRDIYTKAVDVYGYGMICFEILTGKLPFPDHSFVDAKHLVLSGHCLELPTDVDEWLRKLLIRCWAFKPEDRPSFGEILEIISANLKPKKRPSFGEILEIISANSTPIQGNGTMNKEFVDVEPKPVWSQLITLRLSMFIDSLEVYLSCSVELYRTHTYWSELAEPSEGTSIEDELLNAITAENLQLFQELQSNPEWGSFFWTFGDGLDDSGDLMIGEKFAEGAQAEIFHASVSWNSQVHSEDMLRILRQSEYVLKVFKRGTLLRHLQQQWPIGVMNFFGERGRSARTGSMSEWEKPKNTLDVLCGTLLADGRFAFLLERETTDLGSLIYDFRMEGVHDRGPFPKVVAERMMYDIALGMDWLHSHRIVHRDLKASNILVRGSEDDNYECFVADYEGSVGVVGTGFWRAPEILQGCIEKNINKRPYLFSPAADTFSYGMTCYEVLTGKVPFKDHPLSKQSSLLTNLVINQDLRPEIPDFVDDWICELLKWCWQSDPVSRPSDREILNLLERNMS
ncbi:hypothetical protein KC19_5G051000 [Ceratodon purpureus]|uniref:Protein kinase domain-containing protein n=1 Tax=Ceratodon purpureus TaxID=3225 RepID=A0A8T0I0I3_CERPU|nr:hypothetical protein KC19_5G051000 [Ceratodon purpureus]